MFAALAAPRRRELLRLVWADERSAGDLHAALGDVTFGAVSQHLRVLKTAGLVTCRREGRHRLYRADRQALEPVRAWLEQLWDSALYRLKLEAELESGRRGPRTGARRGRKQSAAPARARPPARPTLPTRPARPTRPTRPKKRS